MERRVLEIAGAIGVIILVVALATPWLIYGSRPDVAFKRAWGRLAAAAARPADIGALLPIVFDAQDHALSCEVAALKMALAVRDIRVSESELIAAVGFDPTPKRHEAGRIVWGDPQKGFVGDIDGRMPDTGYGVYADPIARAAQKWNAARAVKGLTPRQLAEELVVGNPVIVWGYLGDGDLYEWQTPEGKTVQAVLHEHTFTAYGFRGSPERPEGFLLMDPIYGPRYWDTQELFDRMEKLGYSGVILY
jgi:hypothetical protein